MSESNRNGGRSEERGGFLLRLWNSVGNMWPANDEAHFQSGHQITPLAMMTWPLLQLSLLFSILSLCAPNWIDGQPRYTTVGGRLYVGAWRACLASAINSSRHPAGPLPVDICTDTSAFIVDALKTGWITAWRTFLILSFISLFITSVLLSCYMFGGRILQHSSFPLFWTFCCGFTSAMFGGLSLMVFHVQSQKSREVQLVSYGWALWLNIVAVVSTLYNTFVMLGEFIELTDFRKRRKLARRRRHMTISAEHTFSHTTTGENALPQGGNTFLTRQIPLGGNTDIFRVNNLPLGGSANEGREGNLALDGNANEGRESSLSLGGSTAEGMENNIPLGASANEGRESNLQLGGSTNMWRTDSEILSPNTDNAPVFHSDNFAHTTVKSSHSKNKMSTTMPEHAANSMLPPINGAIAEVACPEIDKSKENSRLKKVILRRDRRTSPTKLDSTTFPEREDGSAMH